MSEIPTLKEFVRRDSKKYPREIQKTVEKKEEEKDPLERNKIE